MQDDLEKLLHPSCAQVLKIEPDPVLAATADCVLVCKVAVQNADSQSDACSAWEIPCHKTRFSQFPRLAVSSVPLCGQRKLACWPNR